MEYEFNVSLSASFDEAMERVREALAGEQLGIVSEVDVQGIFASKLGKDIPPYRILGACNPKLADRVISAEPDAGVLLPCNVVVRSVDKATTVVSFLDPETALAAICDDEARAVGAEARALLQRVKVRLSA